MDTFRSSLEVLKWLSPKAVLSEYCIVSKAWAHACHSDELWITFFDTEETPALKSCSSFQAGYRHSHCSPFSLFLINKQSIDIFNVRKKKWVRRVRIQRRLPTDTASAYVVLPDGALLICGGGDPVLAATLRVDLNGVVVELQPMEQERAEHGIIQTQSKVYVFGGENNSGLLKSFESLEWEYLTDLPTSRWKELGSMQNERKLFKPCVYKGLIYLYGGFTPSFETYDPATNQCLNLSLSINDFMCETMAVTDGPYLHLFSRKLCLTYNALSCDCRYEPCSKLATVWGKRNGILYHHSVYFTFDNLIHRYDLRKSKLTKVSS